MFTLQRQIQSLEWDEVFFDELALFRLGDGLWCIICNLDLDDAESHIRSCHSRIIDHNLTRFEYIKTALIFFFVARLFVQLSKRCLS